MGCSNPRQRGWVSNGELNSCLSRLDLVMKRHGDDVSNFPILSGEEYGSECLRDGSESQGGYQ